MTRDETWSALLRKYPEWASKGTNFAPAGVRRFFDDIWSMAAEDERGRIMRESGAAGVPDFAQDLLGRFGR